MTKMETDQVNVINAKIGTEHEKLGFEFDTLRPIKYKQISHLLKTVRPLYIII
ncbi:hypothetical protein MTR_5g005860 [Medicago truncatula]|uniref:Uncharacterized protein n=1 Tax=Medicago truncatula TaxID=3880 RepID=G7K2A4_MEDTR|nr:hypothetical protein MTR_5g005860 [Medicago truncatula]